MTDEDRRTIEEYANNPYGWTPHINACKSALDEIDRLKALVDEHDKARPEGNFAYDALRAENERLAAEMHVAQNEIDASHDAIAELEAEISRATTLMRNARVHHKTIAARQDAALNQLTDANTKLRNELSDAHVQLEVYWLSDKAKKKPMTLEHAAEVLSKGTWTFGESRAREIAEKYETSPDVFAITEIHNRVAALEAAVSETASIKAMLAIHERLTTLEATNTAVSEINELTEFQARLAALEAKLNDAKVITHISSGKVYIEVNT